MRVLCILLVASLLPVSAELITLSAPERDLSTINPAQSAETITLAEGDLATVKYVSPNAFLDVTIRTTLMRLDANNPEQVNLPVVAGPATIRLVHFDSLNAALVTVDVKRAGTPAATTPHNVVVIPDDNTGDYDVLLESSTDMVHWTPTTPGQFDAGNTKRFFRVRLARREPSE